MKCRGFSSIMMGSMLAPRRHAVTIFEANEKLGGMMRYGIPGYRTPRDMLDTEIDRIVDLDIEIRLNTSAGKDISTLQLEDGHDAIFWAIGAQSGRPLPSEGWDGTENCINGIEFLDAFNKGWVLGTAQNVVAVGGGDTSIDVASVARRLADITNVAKIEHPDGTLIDFTAHDVADSLTREGIKATLTSLFPINEMTAAEHEREDAKREGVDIRGEVMPLEVIKDADGKAVALKMCECDMDRMRPVPRECTEFEINCDIIISAIGQCGNFAGVEEMDAGKGFIDVDGTYSVRGRDKHFAGGDIIRPHWLTTAIRQGRIAAETITENLSNGEIAKRPRVDVSHFDLLNELRRHGKDSADFDHAPTRGTENADFAVRNYEDRSTSQAIKHTELLKAIFSFSPARYATKFI